MHTLRFPFAVGFGFVVALAVFTLLWKFVNRPIDVATAIKAPDVRYTPKHVDTPVVPPRQPKVVHRPPPLIPLAASQARDNVTDATPIRYEPVRPGGFEPVLNVVDAGRGGPPPIGQDRDVIPLVRVPPDYPPRANSEGWVKVQFSITSSGSVRDAFVVEASPAGVFEAAALKAIARWRYTPKIEGGVAVERVGVQTLIRFELQ